MKSLLFYLLLTAIPFAQVHADSAAADTAATMDASEAKIECEGYIDARSDPADYPKTEVPILPQNQAGYFEPHCPVLLYENQVDLDGDQRTDTIRIIRFQHNSEQILTEVHTSFGNAKRKTQRQTFQIFAPDENINDLTEITLKGKVLHLKLNTESYHRMAEANFGEVLVFRFQKARWEIIGYSSHSASTCNIYAGAGRIGNYRHRDFNLSTGKIMDSKEYWECVPARSKKECARYFDRQMNWKASLDKLGIDPDTEPAEIIMSCDRSPLPKPWSKSYKAKIRALPVSLESLEKISAEMQAFW